ncbi:pyridoxal-phosphate dependent enzyme [Nocardioides panacisoli]|uniref:pyridoxal-phosphate dependent enzyme n=1 Tax=Nocardioides panacisoli TaxID=627624 RepID=UPI001C625784|nr:pyridoxal-phosphate dependent enzyme [Nocardioides panacisoli]QYJ03602.1 pyridoxal-phosphate dependent enzyme [Nocardioides panacisoli]
MTTWFSNPAARTWTTPVTGGGAREFHRSLPGYAVTPLVELPSLAEELGVARVLAKDESQRLGLPAFKVLGASWACRQVLAHRPGAELVTATDGNHGRAVARMARHFEVAATVFVPEVMLPETAAAIESEGARVVRLEVAYDDAVRAAAAYADEAGDRALVQDTAWEGYTEVPAWIVDGYRTLLEEIDEEVGTSPDLVAVPTGVGSLAEAVVRHHRRPGAAHPSVLSVEPDTAACVVASLAAGEPVAVPTGATIMAGLNCGTVSSAAWPVLRDGCDAAVAVTDAEADRAVTDLGALGLSSGPSGAATLAGVRAALGDPERRAALGLPADAVVVLLSTEANPRD